MDIRQADLSDLNACLMIDDAFETEYVWQMDEQVRPGNLSVGFRLTRLPRPMRVTGTIAPDDVARNYQSGGTLLVADNGGVCGFVDITASPVTQIAYINNLLVAPGHRRKGVASELLQAALDWGREQRLRAAMLDTPTKDHPAICLYQKHGFVFCGFNDQLYPNRDIALYFALNLR